MAGGLSEGSRPIMNILSFETSCDETSVAVVRNGTEVLSCETATSMNIHAITGGIIPENAARKQIEYIIPTTEAAIKHAFPGSNSKNKRGVFEQIDAIAVTVGPGLIGSLLVGVETAKTFSHVFQKPLIPVNHVEAHIYATFLGVNTPLFPLLAVVVSGGHTDFVYMKKHGDFERLGGTRDDAAGEAFDKCARLLRLPYPGGPSISHAADLFINKNPSAPLTLLPRPMIHDKTIDVSFSGLKTALSRLITQNNDKNMYSQEQLAAEVEAAIVESLIAKTARAAEGLTLKSVVLCGGVSANAKLRTSLKALHLFESGRVKLHVPEIRYCTDNAAMIGSCAFFNNNPHDISDIDPNPELHF